jgi:hypothetical protein
MPRELPVVGPGAGAVWQGEEAQLPIVNGYRPSKRNRAIFPMVGGTSTYRFGDLRNSAASTTRSVVEENRGRIHGIHRTARPRHFPGSSVRTMNGHRSAANPHSPYQRGSAISLESDLLRCLSR